ALEAIRTGTTTIVENTGNIGRNAAALAQTGLRCVFAESVHDSENVDGPMSPGGLAKSETPRFSAKLREEGLQRINDLFTTWHGAKQGRISVFPAAALAETSTPELLRAVRGFAEKHDLGYTIHLAGHQWVRGGAAGHLRQLPCGRRSRTRLHQSRCAALRVVAIGWPRYAEFRIEAFNILNHQSFGPPARDISVPNTFGTTTS